MSPLVKRLGLAATIAMALGACDYALVLNPDPAAPGATVTVTNAPDGPYCGTPEVEEQGAEAEADGAEPAAPAEGEPVDIFVVSDFFVMEEPEPDATATTDEDGFFTAQVTAPTERPGQHMVAAICGGTEGEGPPIDRRSAATAAEAVDPDGVIYSDLVVTQPPLSIALSDDDVEVGDEVVATFNRCKAENDFGLFTIEGEPVAEPTPEELANDFPDLQVFVDGELVETVEGTERYPTGTVDVPLTFDEEGTHEVEGVCTYQTIDIDFSLFEMLDEPGEPELSGGAQSAAIDYPFVIPGPDEETPFLVADEATTTAADTVIVRAAGVGGTGAEPVPATPTYTG